MIDFKSVKKLIYTTVFGVIIILTETGTVVIFCDYKNIL